MSCHLQETRFFLLKLLLLATVCHVCVYYLYICAHECAIDCAYFTYLLTFKYEIE